MTAPVSIRDEAPGDLAAIHALTREAFLTLEVSSHTEQFIIDALRAAGTLTLSLVAENAGEIVGHIAFSPLTLSDGTVGWYGLGPVSVLPGHQRRGIGSALIETGLARLQALGARGCCLVGHPGYYGRFGFVHPPALSLDGEDLPPEVFFAQCFNGDMPTGTVAFHPAFFTEYPQNHLL